MYTYFLLIFIEFLNSITLLVKIVYNNTIINYLYQLIIVHNNGHKKIEPYYK